MKALFNIKKYGELFIDKIIFESYYPILFTMKNDNGDLFLCVCHQNDFEAQRWLLTKTSPSVMLKVLKDEITLREAFVYYPGLRVSIEMNDNSIVYRYDEQQDWDYQNSRLLPDMGEYLEADSNEFDEEINYFYTMESSIYHSNQFKYSDSVYIADWKLIYESMASVDYSSDKLEISDVLYEIDLDGINQKDHNPLNADAGIEMSYRCVRDSYLKAS